MTERVVIDMSSPDFVAAMNAGYETPRRPWRPTTDTLAVRPEAVERAGILEMLFGGSAPVLYTPGPVATLTVTGPLEQRGEMLASYDTVVAKFEAAMADPGVSVLVMRMDSPGGVVAGAFAATRSMKRAKTKPVYAYADEMAASAAYALASVADAIYLPSSGAVGSVGVLGMLVDTTGAQSAAGIKPTVVRSGALKASGADPVTDTAVERMQARVDELAFEFASLVASSRGLSPEEVLALEGATLFGADAVRAKLADGIADWGDVWTMANEKANALTTAESFVASVIKAAPDLEAKSPDAVAGEILAWRESHARCKAMASELADLKAEAAVKAKADEDADRLALIRAAVLDGKIAPAVAFSDAGQKAPAAAYAEMSLATLRAHVGALAPLVPLRAEDRPKPAPVAMGLDPEDEAVIAATGVDREKYLARKVADAGKVV